MTIITNKRLLQFIGIQAQEVQPVLLLLLYNLCSGFLIVYYKTAAMTLFLSYFTITMLPLVYIASSLVVLGIGLLYVRLEKKLSFEQQRIFFAIFSFCSILLFYIGLQLGLVGFLLILITIWIDVLFTVSYLEASIVSGRIFNIRQGKRIFPILRVGSIVAKVIGGLSVPVLLLFIEIEQLLLIAASWGVIMLFVLIVFVRQYREHLSSNAEEIDKTVTTNVSNIRNIKNNQITQDTSSLLRDSYLQRFFLFSLISSFCFFFLNYMFYAELEIAIPDKQELGSFLGSYFAISGLIGVIVNSFISGRLLQRYGIRIGLLLLPCVLIFGMIAIAITSAISATLLVFWLFVGFKMIDGIIRSSIESPSIQLLLQPLRPERRVWVQRFRETSIVPLSTMISAIALLLLTSVASMGSFSLALILLMVAAVLFGLGIILYKSYSETLMQAIAQRSFGSSLISLDDHDTTKLLTQRLSSHIPAEVIYCLAIFEEADHSKLESLMLELLTTTAISNNNNNYNYNMQIQAYVIERVAALGIRSALPLLQQLLIAQEKIKNPVITAALLQSIYTLGDGEVFDEAIIWLAHNDSEVRAGAIAGLLGSGCLDGILLAGEQFKLLLESDIVAERILAARILGKIAVSSLYHPIIKLLRDPELTVRREALAAAAKLHNPRLLPQLLNLLDESQCRYIASTAIAAHGNAALREIENRWSYLNTQQRRRLIQLLGTMQQNRVSSFLWEQLTLSLSYVGQSYSMALTDALLQALVAKYYCATSNEQRQMLICLIEREIERATWALMSRAYFVTNKCATLDMQRLYIALGIEIENSRERIFHLLALLYDHAKIQAVRVGYFSKQSARKAHAVEILDNIVEQKYMRIIQPLFDEMSESECLALLLAQQNHVTSIFASATCNDTDVLMQILSRPRHGILPWSSSCAIYLAVNNLHNIYTAITPLLKHESPMVRELAKWANSKHDNGNDSINNINNININVDVKGNAKKNTKGNTKGNTNMQHSNILILEKVIILKSVDIFSQTSEEALAHVAAVLEEVEAKVGEPILRKGELGTSMYIIVSGKVRVHDGERNLAELGERSVFGELAALDPEPRSADISALSDTRLLRLHEAALYDLMAEDVARGIIRILCQRMRHLLSELAVKNHSV